MTRLIVDTGPLIETFIPTSRHYRWTLDQWSRFPPPALTCEPVLSEAAFLLEREVGDYDGLLTLIQRGILKVGLNIESHIGDLRTLVRRYRNVPISLADASLIRLSEIHTDCTVFTFDSDFGIYRRHGNKVIPTLMPK